MVAHMHTRILHSNLQVGFQWSLNYNLLPAEITREQASHVYADEADVLNVAMFGKAARQWREENPDLKGNIRDYATIIINGANIGY